MSQDGWLDAVQFGADGLVPVVAQDSRTGDVLMVAYANREALARTAASGQAHYFSRSRGVLWQKGESSGRSSISARSPVSVWRDQLSIAWTW